MSEKPFIYSTNYLLGFYYEALLNLKAKEIPTCSDEALKKFSIPFAEQQV